MNEFYIESLGRTPTQRQKIINALKEAGENGLTNNQLNSICYRYGARISELYEKGYEIEITALGKGLYKYVLRKEPSQENLYINAEEIFLAEICEIGGKSVEKLIQALLSEKGFKICRKHGWYKNKYMFN